MDSVEDIFGEVIFSYSRKQAIEDGVLVDLTEWATSGPDGMLGGFKVPVAVTAAVWADIQAIPASKSWQDVRGRAHDLLVMAAFAGRARGDRDVVTFQVLMDVAGTRTRKQTYKMLLHPGDECEPVVTIMQPGED